MKRIFILLTLSMLPALAIADSIALPTTGTALGNGVGVAQDANYRITFPVTATSNTPTGAVSNAWIPAVIDPKWAPNANWVTPTANGMADLPAGTYTFSVNFYLPAGTSAIYGSLYVDDRVEIALNGKVLTTLPNGPGSGYWANTLSFFTLKDGLLPGLNTLEFRVIQTNPGTPVGLAVQQLTAIVGTETPEPTSLLLLGSGLAGLAGVLKRRRK